MSRLLTLGRFELRTSEPMGAGSAIAMQPKRLALLAYLMLASARGAVRRDSLVALFWPDATADEARNALRQALHHLRQQLGDKALETRPDDQVVFSGGPLACDALDLERAVASGDDVQALALYQGPFLEGVFVRGVSQEFEEWVERTRLRLRSAAADAARRLAEEEAASGNMESAIAAARRRCEIEPEHEGAVRSLLTLLDDHGNCSEALQQAARFEELLRARYEVEPSAETTALVAAIRSGSRAPRPRTSVPAVAAPSSVMRPGPPISRELRWRNVAITVGLLAIISVALMQWRQRGALAASPTFAPTDRLFVTDFVDRTPASRLGALVASAMRVDLGQLAGVRVLTTAQVHAAVRLMDRPIEVTIDDTLARLIAVREGVKAFVTGEVHSVGSAIVLEARLVASPSGDELASAREEARDSADVLPAIARLSEALRGRMARSLPHTPAAAPLTRVTTSSLAALERYTEGTRLLDVGRRAEGVAQLEQAVAIDTGFATAWRILGSTYGVLGEPAKAAAALGRAFQNRERLPFRERHLLMGSYYRNATPHLDSAVAAYRALLALYPDDIAATNNLGLTLTSLGQHAAADSLYRRVIAADSTFVNVRLVLAEGLAAQGKFADARVVLDDAGRRFPDHPVVGLTRIYVAAAASEWKQAEALAQQRLATVTATVQRIDALQTLGQIELVRGKLDAAQRHLEESMRLARGAGSPRKHLWSVVVLGWLDLRYRERPDDARRRLERAIEAWPADVMRQGDVPTPDLLRLASALGETGRVRSRLPATEGGAANPGPEQRQVDGLVALGRGRAREAVTAFSAAAAARPDCPICLLPDLAMAQELAGDTTAAVASLDRYLRTPFIHRFELDAVHLPSVCTRLANLLEGRGDRAGATAVLRQLLATWAEADAGLAPRATAIRARVAQLEGPQRRSRPQDTPRVAR
ncbi:MAG: tetratricopeptide repeat protein [Gemmatimonadaceae bacterium]|nr:tetratricopeptide repeat protein [Gemmatimonadaceae bacterium]